MIQSARRALSLLLCLAMLAPALSGCAKTSELDSAIATLASGGVAVYDDYDSTGPIKALSGTPSAMRLTRWQLSNILAQADAHMGMLGANIDAYEGTKAPKNAPTFSYFIAAWVQRGQGPLAQYAAQLMGTQDWSTAPHITFPLLVVTMFIADAARLPAGTPTTHASTSFNWERLIAAPAQADGICSTVSSFVSQVVTDVENALTVSSNGFFASLWNVAVKLVAGLSEVVIAGVLTPLLSILNAVAGGLAAIGAIASTLKPWTVTVDAQPAQITVGEQQSDGQFVATLDAQAIDWPSQVSDCASVLGGVDLSKVSYADAPVTWKTLGQIPGLATVTTKDATIDANKKATLKYQTVVQQPDQNGSSCPSSQQSVGQGGVQVSVERVDVEHLQAQLANVAFSKLPGFVRSHLVPLFQSQIDSAQKQFAQLVSTAPTGTGSVTFVEMKPNCSPSPSPSASPNTPEPSGYTEYDLLGKWKCEVTAGGNSATLYKTTPSIGKTSEYMTYGGRALPAFESDWSYAPSGPTTGVLTGVTPGLASQARAQAALIGRPVSIATTQRVPVSWISRDHEIENASDAMHSARYDCTRVQ
jgi:hypothetical protein